MPKNNFNNFDFRRDGIAVVVLSVALIFSLYYFNFRAMVTGGLLIDAIGGFSSKLNPDQIAQARVTLFQKVFAADTFLNREAAEQLVSQAIQITRDQNVGPNTKQVVANLAIEKLKQEVARQPHDARTRLLLGSMYDAFGQYPEAIAELSQASNLSPNKQTILFQLAAANLDAKKTAEALKLAERAFHLDERFGEARKFYALVLIYSGKEKLAGEILAGDPSIQPDDRFINAYVSIKRYDLVLKLWQEKVKKNPNDIQSHFNLAAAYLQNNQRALAITELQTAGALDPNVKAQADQIINDIRAGRNPLAQ